MKRFRHFASLLVFALPFVGLFAQNSTDKDIFIPDLGIIIDAHPDTTNTTHVVIGKQKASAAYIESTQELRSMLGQLSGQIEGLESSMDEDMTAISLENQRLRSLIHRMQEDRKREREAAEADLALGSRASAEAAATEVIPAAPASKFRRATVSDVMAAYLSGKYKVVADLCAEIDDSDWDSSTTTQVAYWCADSHFRLGRFDESLLALGGMQDDDHALNDDAIVLRGMIYLKQGRDDLARTQFNKIVSQHPASDYFRLAEMTLKEIHDF